MEESEGMEHHPHELRGGGGTAQEGDQGHLRGMKEGARWGHRRR